MKLEKGAKVKVRLHTGEVVEVVYFDTSEIKRHHVVRTGQSWHRIGRHNGSRFIGNPCDLVPVGMSV